MFSDLPAAKRALEQLLKQRDAIADAKVYVGRLRSELPKERERIYVTRIDPATRTPTKAPQVRRDVAELVVIVEVQAIGADSADAAEARVWQLVDELDAALVERPEIGIFTARLGRVQEDDTAAVRDGWVARCRPRVVLEATTV